MAAITSPTGTVDRRAALDGGRDTVPLLLSVMPLAVVIGATAQRSGLDTGAAWAASILICAGTAQLTAIQLLGDGAAPLAIVLTTTVINGRFALYSARLASWFADEPLSRRLVLAFPLVDQLFFFLCQRQFTGAETPLARRSYYIGSALTLVCGWSATQAVAMTFASSIPDVGVLRLAAPLVLVGLLARSISGRAHLAAAAVGGSVAVLAAGAPAHLNLVIAIGAGLLAGAALDGGGR